MRPPLRNGGAGARRWRSLPARGRKGPGVGGRGAASAGLGGVLVGGGEAAAARGLPLRAGGAAGRGGAVGRVAPERENRLRGRVGPAAGRARASASPRGGACVSRGRPPWPVSGRSARPWRSMPPRRSPLRTGDGRGRTRRRRLGARREPVTGRRGRGRAGGGGEPRQAGGGSRPWCGAVQRDGLRRDPSPRAPGPLGWRFGAAEPSEQVTPGGGRNRPSVAPLSRCAELGQSAGGSRPRRPGPRPVAAGPRAAPPSRTGPGPGPGPARGSGRVGAARFLVSGLPNY